MEKFYKISIPKPCHEDWNTMNPSEKGRFCNSCAKTVVDFTKMSSIQIHEFVRNKQHQKICGHFKKTQLDTIHISIPIQIIKTKHTFRRSFLLALLIAMGTTLVNCTNHEGKQQKIETIEIKETINSKKDVIIPNSVQKKCSKDTPVCNTKKKTETTPEKLEIFEPIEEVVVEGEIVMGDLFTSNKITNFNNPVPAHLLDTFPALSGTKKEKRTSENYFKQIKKIVSKHFNTQIGKDIGLLGVQRIYVQYEIDKEGIIKDIKVRAPHTKLEREAKEVIQKIPKLIPGIYNGKPVRTIYSLPIVFKIEE